MRRPLVLAVLAALLVPAGACRPQRSAAAPTTSDAATPEPAVKPLRPGKAAPSADKPDRDAPASARKPDRDAPASARKPDRDPPAASADESGRLAGITAAHNRVRKRLKIAPLTWSPELARFAQAWADKLARQGCRLKHRPPRGADAQRYGENIFSMTGDTPTPDIVVDAWAGEVKDYDARTNRCKGVCGHYTQVVWRASQRVGCGMAACGDTEVWVCNYDPRGNYQGERPY